MKNQVISLYDYTGEALQPWAEAGYDCFAYDIQHVAEPMDITGLKNMRKGPATFYFHADLYDHETLLEILVRHSGKVAFMSAFPPCTDLSAAGAVWWSKKAKERPFFQTEAANHVMKCSFLGAAFGCPHYIENPVGALSRLWRKPDHMFNPYEFGGYLPRDDQHPRWPDIIPPRDAYRKRTCLWTGSGFTMPEKKDVPFINVVCKRKDPKKGSNYSPIQAKTGGKSLKTKNIRSATPRGFAKAVFLANQRDIDARFGVGGEI